MLKQASGGKVLIRNFPATLLLEFNSGKACFGGEFKKLANCGFRRVRTITNVQNRQLDPRIPVGGRG